MSKSIKLFHITVVILTILRFSIQQETFQQLEARLINNLNQRKNNPSIPKITLTNEDFKYGSLLIDKPGVYQLGENISFNPNSLQTLRTTGIPATHRGRTVAGAPLSANPATTAWFAGVGEPHPLQFTYSQGPYSPKGFVVGFFAAIVVFSNDVTIDLNGFTLEQSDESLLLQRFYANIETCSVPFIENQGPANFGAITCAENLAIINGKLGKASHHGIHGNNNVDILVQNVTFIEYEVGPLQFNQAKNVVISNCHALGHKATIPVNVLWSHLRFLRPYLKVIQTYHPDIALNIASSGTEVNIDQTYKILEEIHEEVYQGVLKNGQKFKKGDRAYELFGNFDQIPDGSVSYGFVFNGRGFAINGFPEKLNSFSENIYIKSSSVRNIVLRPIEIPAIKTPSGLAHVKDPVGGVFDLFTRNSDGQLSTINADQIYIGNPLANAQLFVFIVNDNHPNLFPEHRIPISLLSFDQRVVDYVQKGLNFKEAKLDFFCNGDGMLHVNKGIIGFKLDNVVNALVENSYVDGAVNSGPLPYTFCGNYVTSHPLQNQHGIGLQKYGGNNIRGFSMAASRDIILRNTEVKNFESYFGLVLGYDAIGEASNIQIINSKAINLKAGTKLNNVLACDHFPLPLPIVAGVIIREGIQNFQVTQFQGTNLGTQANMLAYEILKFGLLKSENDILWLKKQCIGTCTLEGSKLNFQDSYCQASCVEVIKDGLKVCRNLAHELYCSCQYGVVE